MKPFFCELKAIFFVLLFLFNQTNIVSQNYVLSPGKNFTATVDTSQLNYNGIEIINTGTISLDFTWELLLKDTLIDSEFDLCNSGICFNTLPVNGIMPTITPGQIGFLKMHMFSGKTEGVNTIKYILKNAFLAKADTLTYVINVGNTTTSLKYDKAKSSKIILHPNPTKESTTINIDLMAISFVKVFIYDALGNLVFERNENVSNSNPQEIKINTTDYASGVYSVLILTNNGAINQKLAVSK